MNKKLLSCALLGAMSLAQSAMAQEFDDRWYVTAGAAYLNTDVDRDWGNAPILELGVGRMITPKYSLDLELERSNPSNSGLDWEMTSASLVARRYFMQEGRSWAPYLAFGAGAQHHAEDFSATGKRKGTDLMAKLGAGLQAEYGQWALRAEAGGRFDQDDNSIIAPNTDRFVDLYFGATALFRFGAAAEAPAAPVVAEPAPQKTCADLDDDGDGVNNCNDKCPASQAGQAIGPDGCPVPLTIDLKGVNFDFDKATLRPDAITILDEAASILQKYPQLRVEVAGHTDAVGAENYNQGLSERRARAVYDYLAGKGIDASRMVGPTGYGEARPIDSNDTAEGRARNRRTELNVQN